MGAIEREKFVCLDCETTGLNPAEDRIIEIALLCFDAQEVYDQFESLIDPGCEIPPPSIEIHHITQEMVQGKPSISELLPSLLELIGNRILVGHGIGFDIEILAAAADRAGIPSTIRKNCFFDTLRMARLYGESPINSLEHLRKHFNIPLEGAHRAMNDVIVNREVFRHLAKPFKTVEQLSEVLSKPILMSVMPLGKHKGRALKEIPLQYLQWIVVMFDQNI